MKTIGITSTIPVEIIYASGNRPMDLNNAFITSQNPMELIRQAEHSGLSRNLCGWIRGLYPLSNKVDEIVVIAAGDCSNMVALADLWKDEKVPVIFFDYPHQRTRNELKISMERLIKHFGTDWNEVKKSRLLLDPIRRKLHEIDRLTWQESKVSGEENHIWLLNSSDFNGNPGKFEKALDAFLKKVSERTPQENKKPRLGLIGVPTIMTDLHKKVSQLGAKIVYNEVAHQFTLPELTDDLVDPYLKYTYPYDTQFRLQTIRTETKRRNLDGLILYVENFCYKNIQNTYFRRKLAIPSIEIEGGNPGPVDDRTQIRLEGFIQMLSLRKRNTK
ncbi:MAG: 2-hydroxyacyl-CoA dehydratase [Candidatus Theseobacter exili]|nr:2-hydroxyacyl-CoA dehydratase [Candidatus Theseobacter exili]